MRRLLLWHAAEEMEHQSVAHDVYVHLYDDGVADRAVRARALVDAGRLVASMAERIVRRLLAKEARPTAAHRWEFLRFMAFSPGYGRRVSLRAVRCLRPGFAPWSDRRDLTLIRDALSAVT